MATIQELKTVKKTIQDNYSISASEAARVVGYINTNNTTIIHDILSGDCSGVPSVLSALDIKAAGSAEKTAENVARDPVKKTRKRSAADDNIKAASSLHSDVIKPAGMMGDIFTDNDNKSDMSENNADIMPAVIAPKNTSQSHDIQADIIPAIDGDIITPSSVPGLPDGFGDVVEGWLSDWSIKYKIDLVKASGQQWRSACIYVGSNIQRSGVLIDRDKMKRGGSKYYSPEAALALLYLWEYITGLYRHIPLVSDFIAFTGASREWFYDTKGKGLSSSRVDLLKKARAIEEAGISAGIIDGRENPTGRIYYSKARLGWQETAPAVAAPVAVVVAVGDLPALTKNVDK